MTPRVRVVVLNYNGGELTLRCLKHLQELDWPQDRLQVVVVDNASSDGSPDRIRELFPETKLIISRENLGFVGNNLGLRNLDEIDYVALLNNDAFVEPDWLVGLVAAIETDSKIGAVNSKIVFAPSFREVTLTVPTFTPGATDPRELGVRVSGVTVRGEDAWRHSQFAEGFYGFEHGAEDEATFRWTSRLAKLRVPVDGKEPEGSCGIRVAAEKKKSLRVRSAEMEESFEVGSEPEWIEIPLRGKPFDVINNVGSMLMADGFGADRGFLERDRGQYEEPAEVFAWCGCSVLFRKEYLEDVGLLDEKLYLYYEDFDLSWRGRARGWRYLYSPTSVVRHVHAATSVEWSPLFHHYVDRNRLVVMMKNAPIGFASKVVFGYVLTLASTIRRDVIGAMLRGRRPATMMLRRRLKAFSAFLALLPHALRARRAKRRSHRVTDDELMAWRVAR